MITADLVLKVDGRKPAINLHLNAPGGNTAEEIRKALDHVYAEALAEMSEHNKEWECK